MFDLVASAPRPEIRKYFRISIPIRNKGSFDLEIYHDSSWSLKITRKGLWGNGYVIRLDISSPNPDDEEGTYTRTVNLLFDPVTQAERNEGYFG